MSNIFTHLNKCESLILNNESPKTKIRSISKCFESVDEDKDWFYNKETESLLETYTPFLLPITCEMSSNTIVGRNLDKASSKTWGCASVYEETKDGEEDIINDNSSFIG